MRSTMSLFAVTVISLCLVQPLKAQPLITVAPLFELTEFGHILGLSTGDPAALNVRLDVPFVNSEEPVLTRPLRDSNKLAEPAVRVASTTTPWTSRSLRRS